MAFAARGDVSALVITGELIRTFRLLFEPLNLPGVLFLHRLHLLLLQGAHNAGPSIHVSQLVLQPRNLNHIVRQLLVQPFTVVRHLHIFRIPLFPVLLKYENFGLRCVTSLLLFCELFAERVKLGRD